MEYTILHLVQVGGDGERLVIVEAPASEEDKVPAVGFKLHREYPADIEDGSALPLGRQLVRGDF